MYLSEHDRQVQNLVEYMNGRGIDVFAASLPDAVFNRPIKVGRHEPDVIGELGGKYFIGEAKTINNYNSTKSIEQYIDFGKSLADAVYLKVPESVAYELKGLLQQLGIRDKYVLMGYANEQK